MTTTLHLPPLSETGVDLPTALAHLAAAGIPTDVVVADGVDPCDPHQLRDLVDELLASALAEDSIADARQVCDLRAALDALTNDGQRAALDDLAADVRAFLTRVRERDTRPDRFGDACLNAE